MIVQVNKSLRASKATSGYQIVKCFEEQGYVIDRSWTTTHGALLFSFDKESFVAFKLKYGSHCVNMEDVLG